MAVIMFVVGVVFGGFVGCMVTAVCVASSRNDIDVREEMEK